MRDAPPRSGVDVRESGFSGDGDPSALLAALSKRLAELEAEAADALQGARWNMFAHSLRYAMHTPDAAERRSWVNELLVRYQEGLPLGDSLPDTDLQIVDPYALLAANLLIDEYDATSSEETLLQAAAVLATALSNSQHNIQARLLLVKVYGLLGAAGAAMDMWKGSGIKQIHLDSCGWVLLDALLPLGAVGQLEDILAESDTFYQKTAREMPEFIVNTYRWTRTARPRNSSTSAPSYKTRCSAPCAAARPCTCS